MEIPLTQGRVAIVDDDDAERILERRWRVKTESRDLSFIYAVSGFGAGGVIRMHRFIVNAPTGTLVDHVSGDTLDNRKGNLRICDKYGNARNRGKSGDGYKGVCWNKNSMKWQAAIKMHGKSHHLGLFQTAIEAAAAYDLAAQRMFGEFAKLNFH